MTIKNRYIHRAKISEEKFRNLLRYFAHDLDAQTIADLARLNRNTVNRYLHIIRKRLACLCEQAPLADRPRENFMVITKDKYDERSAYLKYRNQHVFGIIKNKKTITTELVPETLRPEIGRLIDNTQSFESKAQLHRALPYDSVVVMVTRKQYRIIKSHELAKQNHAIDLAETFWGFTKGRLSKFFGISDSTFYFHLKECEFRFNHRSQNLYKYLLKTFRNDPLF